MTGIEAFNREIEAEDRHCLFCKANPPHDLSARDMKGTGRHWFSGALFSPRLQRIARFYLCPKHRNRRLEAYQWIKDGFAEEEIATLKGMDAVRVWLSYHLELTRYIER